jgi:peptidoglycan hydrolase-like protein with peptidoglycan-binding domain
MGADEIRLTNTRAQATRSSGNENICRMQDNMLLVDLSRLGINGSLTPREIQASQADLRANANADTTATREQVAERANAPAGYRENGRYTEAAADGEVGEGYRGDRVRQVQQQLVDGGYLTGDNAVDGYWGPQTQAAYERMQSAQRGQQGSDELVRDIRNADTDAINRRLATSSNAELREIDSRLPRNGDGTYSTRLGGDLRGDDSDYVDFSNRLLQGRRNEGSDARADSPQTDDFQNQLLNARIDPFWGGIVGNGNGWGTDEAAINQVFSRASHAQLMEIDRRLRTGVRDQSGSTVQFNDGLAGLIRSEIGDGAHREALLEQLRGGGR